MSLTSVTLEVADPEAAHRFHSALGVETRVRLRASGAHTGGFRGFTLALTVPGELPSSTGSSPMRSAPVPTC